MALSPERLVCAVAIVFRDLSHWNFRIESREGDDLSKSTSRQSLGNARAASKRPIKLPPGDEKLPRQPHRADSRVAVMLVNQRETAVTQCREISSPHVT